MFNLTPEQVKEIMLDYCDSLNVISTVISKVNEMQIVDNEDDFFTVVAAVCTRYQTIKTTAFPDLIELQGKDPFAADRQIENLLNLEGMITYTWKRLRGEDKSAYNCYNHQYILSPENNQRIK